MDNTLDRRTALRLGGAATVAAVAGCSDLLGGGGSSSGSSSTQYSQYLSVGDNQVFFAYADFEALEEFNTGEQGGGGGGDENPSLDEPMLAPASGLILIAFTAGFQLGALGLGGLIQTESESDLESQGNQILVANSAVVIAGEMNTDEIDEQLTSTSSDNSLAAEYEQVDESDGYTFYEPAGENQSSGVVAVNDSELLSADSRDGVDAVIDAINGDGRAADEFDEFQWLLDNGGDGIMAFGGYGPDGFSGSNSGSGNDSESNQFSFVENSGGFVGSISLDSETASSVLAASSEQISEDQREQIESDLQSDQTDVSIDFRGDGRLVAEATYSRDVLEGGNSET